MGSAKVRAIEISAASVLATNINVERVGSLTKEECDPQLLDDRYPNISQELNSPSVKPMRLMVCGTFKNM